MKHTLVLAAALLLSAGAMAQNKDCKFVTAKTPDGQSFSMIQVPGRLGNFLVGKADGKITMNYNTKFALGLLATDTKNLASLKIDSAQFLFADNSVITIKTAASIGKLPNFNNQLKPQMTTVQYSITLIPGSKPEMLFKQTKLKGFRVIAEKEGQYSDIFNDKQQDKLLQAFTCLP